MFCSWHLASFQIIILSAIYRILVILCHFCPKMVVSFQNKTPSVHRLISLDLFIPGVNIDLGYPFTHGGEKHEARRTALLF